VSDLARSIELARELLDDEDLCHDPVAAEWLAAQRTALDDALAAGDREQLVAVLARLGLMFATPRGRA